MHVCACLCIWVRACYLRLFLSMDTSFYSHMIFSGQDGTRGPLGFTATAKCTVAIQGAGVCCCAVKHVAVCCIIVQRGMLNVVVWHGLEPVSAVSCFIGHT